MKFQAEHRQLSESSNEDIPFYALENLASDSVRALQKYRHIHR